MPELGPWTSFNKAYPREPLADDTSGDGDLADKGEVTVGTSYQTQLEYLQGWPFTIGPARVARVYSYVRGTAGADPENRQGHHVFMHRGCRTARAIKIAIPCSENTRGREACVLFSIDWQWPDPFNPKLPDHIRRCTSGNMRIAGLAGCLSR